MLAASGGTQTGMLVLRLTLEGDGSGLIATITQVADVLTGEAERHRSSNVDDICERVRALVDEFVERAG